MHVFTIRDVENLTGIKAHTLRIWEQRYQLMVPERKISKHRLYSNEDLKHMLKISTLYHNGYKISRIAALDKEQINRFTLDTLVIRDPYQVYVSHLLEASIDLDENRFEKIVHTCILHYGFEKTMFKVLFSFLNKVGLLWMTGNVVPAMEHFASSIIMRKLLVALNGLEQPSPNDGPVVLLFTPEEERHEIPILMMQYVLKKKGVKTVLLGQHVSVETLEAYCTHKPATHLYAHIITYLQKCEVEDYIEELSKKFANKQIVLSGSIVQGLQRNFLNVRVLKDENEMMEFANEA